MSPTNRNYLSHLNLSHNQITTVKHLDQAKSLVEINLGKMNFIHQSLSKKILNPHHLADNNMITEIKMSRSSCSLRVIYANNNKLVEMDGRFYGHVELLSLNRNGVERIVNEDGFKRLEYLSICHQSPESVPELRYAMGRDKAIAKI